MKVCVIGNSHAGSLLGAMDELPEDRRPAWDFFVAPNGFRDKAGLKAIAHDSVRGAFLGFPYYRSDRGADAVIADYDCFILVGAHHPVGAIAGMLKQEMSDRFRAAALAEICQTTRLYRFAQAIRSTSTARILLTTRLAPTDANRADVADIARTAAEVAAFWARHGVELIAQPQATLTPEGLTRAEALISVENHHFTLDASTLVLETLRAALAAPRAVRSSE